MNLLVRTPAPFQTESLLGFVLRISETNGYETPGHLLRLAGVDPDSIQTAGFPVNLLAPLLGRREDSLSHISYQFKNEKENTKYFKILGNRLGLSMKEAPLRLGRAALCPSCVKEDGFVDAFLDLSAAVACPRHHCKPLMVCPNCDKSIRLFRPGLLTCSCGANWHETLLPKVNTEVAELMGIIAAKLHGKELAPLSNTSNFPILHLDKLSLSSLLIIIGRLGKYNFELRKSDGIFTSEIDAAIAVLSHWPGGYHDFLTNLGNKFFQKNLPTTGLRKQFASFYEMMFKGRTYSVEVSFLREEFIKFGATTWGKSAIDGKLVKASMQLEKRFISKSDYARRYRIWKPTMDSMISGGQLVAQKIVVGNRSCLVIDTEQTIPPSSSESMMTGRSIASFIGLPVSVLQHLRNTGLFETVLRRGKISSWYKEDAEKFLSRARALTNIGVPDIASVSLKDMMRLKLRDATSKADIVSAIFDGRLSPICRADDNLNSFLFDATRVDEFILQKKSRVDGNSYSAQQVAKLTRLNSLAVTNAIQLGLISSITNKERTRVTAQSVADFNDRFTPLSSLADRWGTLSPHLLRICRKNDIEVIIVPYSNGVRQQPILPRSSEGQLYKIWNDEFIRRSAKNKASNSIQRSLACVEALGKYLDQIKNSGQKLPRRNGEPNKVVIAKACGFNRDTLYKYKDVIELLDEFDKKEHERMSDTPLSDIGCLRKYLKELKSSSGSLPTRIGGQVNIKAIAHEVGINRKFFYNHKEAKILLEVFVNECEQR